MAQYKKLINLAKELDFKTEEEYFEYMIDSYWNGNLQQCRDLMKAMRWEDRVKALAYIMDNSVKSISLFYVDYLTK